MPYPVKLNGSEASPLTLVVYLGSRTTASSTVTARPLADLPTRLQSLDVPRELRRGRCGDTRRDCYTVERLREVGQSRGDDPLCFASTERIPPLGFADKVRGADAPVVETAVDGKRESQGIKTATTICQSISGATIDTGIAAFVLATLTPLALEVALNVTGELAANAEHADTIRAAHVQRAQHHADAARRRYLAVDPASRLVADALEADWNTALRDLADAQDDYTKAKTDPANLLNDDQRQRIRALAADLPALWNDPATPLRERKRLIRLLVTDVTMLRNDTSITVHLRLPGGQDHTMTVPLAPQHWHKNPTPATTLAILDQLLDTATFAQTAAALTQRGLADGAGRPFTPERVRYHCSFFHIPTRSQRLHARGLLTLDEIAKRFDVHPCTVKRWRELGLLNAEQSSDAPAYMFHPDQQRPSLAAVWAAESAQRQGAPSSFARLHAAGLLTSDEAAAEHGVTVPTIIHWRELGLLTGEQTDLKNRWLYHPHQPAPSPATGRRRTRPPQGAAETTTP